MCRATRRLDKSAQPRKVSQNKRIYLTNLEQQKQIILMKLIDQQRVCSLVVFVLDNRIPYEFIPLYTCWLQICWGGDV